MKRILKSGDVFMGTCGDPTGLYDSDGNSLHVGDLVAVWTQDVKTAAGTMSRRMLLRNRAEIHLSWD